MLSDAVTSAKKIFDTLAQSIETKKQESDRQIRAMNVQDLFWSAYRNHWQKPQYEKSGWCKEAKRIYLRNIEPTFGDTQLSDISARTVRAWHKQFEKTPYKANRSLEVLSKLFRFAEEMEWRSQGTNPCSLVRAFTEKQRKRYASDDEIKRVGQILIRESKAYPAGVAFLYLLIFSGARPRAIERATWDQLQIVKAKGKTYGILMYEGKSMARTGQEETVFIPPQVMKLILQLPRVEGKTIIGQKLPRKLWRRIKKEAGCPDLWARDFRRTFATIGLSNGVEIGIIGELLNHQTTETTKIYAKLQDDKRIKAATKIAGKLELLLKSKKGRT